MSKQGFLEHLYILMRQAAFDGDGNNEAMFAGLYNDARTVQPDSAFDLRASFVDGSEEKARAAASEPVAAVSPTDVASEATPAATEPTAPVLPADAVADAGGVSSDAAEAKSDGALTDAAHEADQDAKVAALHARVEQLEAEKMAGKLAPTSEAAKTE